MDKNKLKKYVLTGSSYSGKTTLINELAIRGYHTVPEGARLLIKSELDSGGLILPWINRRAFLEKLDDFQMDLESKIDGSASFAFLDRGLPDDLAYYRLHGIEPSRKVLLDFGNNEYEHVFLLETLPGYQTDDVRKEPLELVQKLRVMHEQAYRDWGYDVTVVPVMSVEERLDFILSNCNLR